MPDGKDTSSDSASLSPTTGPARSWGWLRNKPRRVVVALLALGLGLLVTAYAAFQVRLSIEKKAADQFAFACDQITLKIQERLTAYALLLRGGQGLFAASDAVTREEWHAYVEAVRASEIVPGYQGIGFSQFIAKEDLAAHIARLRGEGFSDYAVQPAGERDAYSSIIYLEPFAGRNLRAFGYDMFSDPVRRQAMERARDTGRATLSGKVTLVQEDGKDVQAGTLMYFPVYRQRAPTNTVEERRAALLGWVYSPYRMNDLMNGIMQQDWRIVGDAPLDLHIYDGQEASAANLLFDSQPAGQKEPVNLFHQTRTMTFNGRPWHLEFNARQAASQIKNTPAWVTLAGGVVISGLIFGLLMVIYKRSDALEMAEELAAQIRGMAFQDSLTRLPNRRLLHDRIEMALAGNRRSGQHAALLMIDLDNFKPLNDRHGHAAGDHLLIEVARRLRACVREVDTVARIGGDEFVVLLVGFDQDAGKATEKALAVAENIRVALARPYVLSLDQGQVQLVEHVCSCSIGVALAGSADTDQNKIMNRADHAMYQAKKSGRNRVAMSNSAPPGRDDGA